MMLLELFRELSLHPKNAAELKGLILQLAVQGKLTAKWREENPDVEPASELLKRISTEKQQLIKAGKIKKENPLPPIKAEEMPFKLPEEWLWCRLGDTGITQTGSTPPKNRPDYFGNFIPFIGPAHISNHNFIYPTNGLSEKGLLKGRLITKDSLMMVCIGGSIGKCNVNSIDVSCNQQINTITPIINHSIMLKIICQSSFFQEEIKVRSTGSATPIINKGKWETIPLPLPPLEEQHAIVTTVNQLFAEIEQLEQLTKERIQLKQNFAVSALQRLVQAGNINGEWAAVHQHFHTFFNEKANVKKLRETILQLAVQGKLTTHWRKENSDTEPATELLKRIAAEKQQLIQSGKIKKVKPLPQIKEDEIPFELPEGWVWCRLGELLHYTDAGKSPNCEKRPVTINEWGVITTTSIQLGRFLENENKVLPISYKVNKAMAVEIGDILITRAGPLNRTGIVCRVKNLSRLLILSDKTIRLKHFEKEVDGDFIVLILNSLTVREILKRKMIGMAESQVNISQGNIQSTEIPVPPLQEQHAIVTTVNSLMGLCDALEQELGQQESQVEELMRSCLREVVEGDSIDSEDLPMAAEDGVIYGRRS
jgi:type I restriction enzyme, S subunit